MSTTADHLSYQRARTVALIGLVIQIILALTVLIYGVQGGDNTARAAFFVFLLGIPVWFALWLVLHQHRLERLEALEAEALTEDTSVFGEGSDSMVHASRLAWMHKWFLPAVSIVLALVYIAGGLIFMRVLREQFRPETFIEPQHHGWAIAVGVGVAITGFVFARFAAGMAKQPVWMLLNTGAGVAVSGSLMGALIAVAHFLAAAIDSTTLLRLAPQIGLSYMILVGAEIILNFLLNLYRPRKRGDYLRPAMDSRVLAFIAAPDRLAKSINDAINYQFGFNVSSTWFYRLISRWVAALVLLGLAVIWLTTSFVVVQSDETGVLLRNGRVVNAEIEPGLVVKRPWPFDRVQTFTSSAVNEIIVGNQPDDDGSGAPNLWTDADATDEQFFLVKPSRRGGQIAARDFAMLSFEVPFHYVVTDLEAYLNLAQDGPDDDPEQVRRDFLRSIASGVAIQSVAQRSVDEIMGPEQDTIAQELVRMVQDRFDRLGTGVQITFGGISGVRPPQEAAASFEQVVQADNARDIRIQEAQTEKIQRLTAAAGDVDRADRIVAEIDALEALQDAGAPAEAIAAQRQRITELITAAGGKAAQRIASARAQRWTLHMGERAQAVRSVGRVAAFLAAPAVYRVEQFLSATREVANGARVFVVSGGIQVELDQTEITTGFDLGGSSSDGSETQE